MVYLEGIAFLVISSSQPASMHARSSTVRVRNCFRKRPDKLKGHNAKIDMRTTVSAVTSDARLDIAKTRGDPSPPTRVTISLKIVRCL